MRYWHDLALVAIASLFVARSARGSEPPFIRALGNTGCSCSNIECNAVSNTTATQKQQRQGSGSKSDCISECCTCYCDAYEDTDCQQYCSSTLTYTCGNACCTCDSSGGGSVASSSGGNGTNNGSGSGQTSSSSTSSGNNWGKQKPWYSFSSFHLPVRGGPKKGRPKPKGKPKGKGAPKHDSGVSKGGNNNRWGGNGSGSTSTASSSSSTKWTYPNQASNSSQPVNEQAEVSDSTVVAEEVEQVEDEEETCRCIFWDEDGCELWFEGSVRLTADGAACAERCCGPRDGGAVGGETVSSATSTVNDGRSDVYTGSGVSNNVSSNSGTVEASTKGDAKRHFAILALAVGAACMGILMMAMLAIRNRRRKEGSLLDLEDGRSPHPLHGIVNKRMNLFSRFAGRGSSPRTEVTGDKGVASDSDAQQ